jgi:HPt (histidine-containing phosphotransfer) domain-containing protein
MSNLPPPHTTAAVLDGKAFRELLESLRQPAALAAVYHKFIGNAAGFIRDLRAQDDAARVETLHTLKGSAAMMGARRMAQLAAHLQVQRQYSSVQFAEAIDELESELEKLRLAVDEQLLALGVPPKHS